MYKALVWCRAGLGSSLVLKVKVDDVIRENNFPIQTSTGNGDTAKDFGGDLLISMDDLTKDMKGVAPYVIGVKDVSDAADIKKQLKEFLAKTYAKEAKSE